MQNPQWQDRSPDDLTGSPELFATNLLLVRAMDQELDRIEIARHDDSIGVTLVASDRDYEEETLTEETDNWSKIVERFQTMTEFETDEYGSLQPSIPVQDPVDEMEIHYEDDQITVSFHYH